MAARKEYTRAENAAKIVQIGKTKKMKGKRSDNEHVPNEQIFSIVVSGRPVATASNDCRTADFLEQSELSNVSLGMNTGSKNPPNLHLSWSACHDDVIPKNFPSRVQTKTFNHSLFRQNSCHPMRYEAASALSEKGHLLVFRVFY